MYFMNAPYALLVLLMQVLLVHLSEKPLQLWTILETNLEICLSVLRDKNRKRLFHGMRTLNILKSSAEFCHSHTHLLHRQLDSFWLVLQQNLQKN